MNISEVITGIVAKRLSDVEVSKDRSNQHEFNAVSKMIELFGKEKKAFETRFLYLDDTQEQPLQVDSVVTWYDARERHPTRTEYRLYYVDNDVVDKANVGDLLVICYLKTGGLLLIVCPKGTTIESQIIWLFGLEEVSEKFTYKGFLDNFQELGFASKIILDSLNILPEESEPSFLDLILETFGEKLPTTIRFSEFARGTLKGLDPVNEPDETFMAWFQRELLLFKTLEKYNVEKKLAEGFNGVDEFLAYSLSIQNARKSRAGHAFENHLAFLFDSNNIRYSHGKVTENKNKPDFIFPGIKEYHDSTFKVGLLTMLGLKTTAKDRWRQILPEARRISEKHLSTLQPAISKDQTDQMSSENVHLVIPKEIQETYSMEQRRKILTFGEFINQLKGKQR